MDMSYVFAAPELVESAAQDLAGISSALGQATSAAAAPTTSVLAAGADEVSAAIAQLFGAHGQEFQAISAQAAAFHDEFVGLLNAGAGAYASAEASGVQSLVTAAGRAKCTWNLRRHGGCPVPRARREYVCQPAKPAKCLGCQSDASSEPDHRQSDGLRPGARTGFQSAVQNLPAGLANVPANIQAGFQALSTANPAAVLQGIANHQAGFAQTISTSLQAANNDFVTGLNELPASFQAASQAFAAGDTHRRVAPIRGGLLKHGVHGL